MGVVSTCDMSRRDLTKSPDIWKTCASASASLALSLSTSNASSATLGTNDQHRGVVYKVMRFTATSMRAATGDHRNDRPRHGVVNEVMLFTATGMCDATITNRLRDK